MRYSYPTLNGTTDKCSADNCDADYDLEHACSCKKGGNIIANHDDVMKALQQVGLTVLRDKKYKAWAPFVRTEAETRIINDPLPPNTPKVKALRADLGIKNMIQSGSGIIMIDGRCTFPDSRARVEKRQGVDDILKENEEEKHRKHGLACQRKGHKFIPFVWTPCGVLGKGAKSLIKLFADKLARQWNRPKGRCKGWINGQLAIAIARATSGCIRRHRGVIGLAAYDMPSYDGAAIASGVIRF